MDVKTRFYGQGYKRKYGDPRSKEEVYHLKSKPSRDPSSSDWESIAERLSKLENQLQKLDAKASEVYEEPQDEEPVPRVVSKKSTSTDYESKKPTPSASVALESPCASIDTIKPNTIKSSNRASERNVNNNAFIAGKYLKTTETKSNLPKPKRLGSSGKRTTVVLQTFSDLKEGASVYTSGENVQSAFQEKPVVNVSSNHSRVSSTQNSLSSLSKIKSEYPLIKSQNLNTKLIEHNEEQHKRYDQYKTLQTQQQELQNQRFQDLQNLAELLTKNLATQTSTPDRMKPKFKKSLKPPLPEVMVRRKTRAFTASQTERNLGAIPNGGHVKKKRKVVKKGLKKRTSPPLRTPTMTETTIKSSKSSLKEPVAVKKTSKFVNLPRYGAETSVYAKTSNVPRLSNVSSTKKSPYFSKLYSLSPKQNIPGALTGLNPGPSGRGLTESKTKNLTEVEIQLLVRDVEDVSVQIQKYIAKWDSILKANLVMDRDDDIRKTVLSACVLLDTKLKRAKELLSKYKDMANNNNTMESPTAEMLDALLYYQLTQLDVASVTRMFKRLDTMLTPGQ